MMHTVVKGRGIPHFVNQAIQAFQQPQSDASPALPLDTEAIAARAALAGTRASPGPLPRPGPGAAAATVATAAAGEEEDAASPQLIVASGGNAGIAAAWAARALDVPCTVFLPSSAASLAGVLAREGPPGGRTHVRIGGAEYRDALARAERLQAEVGPRG